VLSELCCLYSYTQNSLKEQYPPQDRFNQRTPRRTTVPRSDRAQSNSQTTKETFASFSIRPVIRCRIHLCKSVRLIHAATNDKQGNSQYCPPRRPQPIRWSRNPSQSTTKLDSFFGSIVTLSSTALNTFNNETDNNNTSDSHTHKPCKPHVTQCDQADPCMPLG
jgi:hypothetical protein